MPRRCSICARADLPEVEAAILQGEPFRGIARRFETSDDAIRRHAGNHIAKKLARAADLDADSLLRKILDAESAARRLLKRAEQKGELGAAIGAVRALSDVLRLTGAALAARRPAAECPRCCDLVESPDPVARAKRIIEILTVLNARGLLDTRSPEAGQDPTPPSNVLLLRPPKPRGES